MAEEGPIRRLLSDRRTLILREPLVQVLGLASNKGDLHKLFVLQDKLIEHKFPISGIFQMRISDAGDIYREMAGGRYRREPYYPYIDEKWARLISFTSRRFYLTEGDIEDLRYQIGDPSYRARRDEYLRNLQSLKEETTRTPMDPKRGDVMMAALDMISALAFWFESLDRFHPPTAQMDRLTETISLYFPEEFYRE